MIYKSLNNGEKEHYKLEGIQTNNKQTNSFVIDAFIECVRLDQDPLVSGHDALSSLKVILGILEAAETNRVVTV